MYKLSGIQTRGCYFATINKDLTATAVFCMSERDMQFPEILQIFCIPEKMKIMACTEMT